MKYLPWLTTCSARVSARYWLQRASLSSLDAAGDIRLPRLELDRDHLPAVWWSGRACDLCRECEWSALLHSSARVWRLPTHHLQQHCRDIPPLHHAALQAARYTRQPPVVSHYGGSLHLRRTVVRDGREEDLPHLEGRGLAGLLSPPPPATLPLQLGLAFRWPRSLFQPLHNKSCARSQTDGGRRQLQVQWSHSGGRDQSGGIPAGAQHSVVSSPSLWGLHPVVSVEPVQSVLDTRWSSPAATRARRESRHTERRDSSLTFPFSPLADLLTHVASTRLRTGRR